MKYFNFDCTCMKLFDRKMKICAWTEKTAFFIEEKILINRLILSFSFIYEGRKLSWDYVVHFNRIEGVSL